MSKMNAEEIINYIGNAKKVTPVKVYFSGEVGNIDLPESVQVFKSDGMAILIGDYKEIAPVLPAATDYYVETAAQNSAVPMLDIKGINARIEPGAIIRDQVEIGDNAVVMAL